MVLAEGSYVKECDGMGLSSQLQWKEQWKARELCKRMWWNGPVKPTTVERTMEGRKAKEEIDRKGKVGLSNR